MATIRLATRVSKLAMIQTEQIKAQLQALDPSLNLEIVGIKTQGDIILDQSLSKIGGKGLFIKELEQALLDDRADIAVHSMKDVPFECFEGLEIAAITEREDPRDVMYSVDGTHLKDMPEGAVIGTSSLRRQMQILAMYPKFDCKPIRGNVLTRMEKCEAGEFDALVLAAAGMLRLDLGNKITEYLEVGHCLPAVGQGAIGVEVRSNDSQTKALVSNLNHLPTKTCVLAERAMNATLRGSCSIPLAGFATIQANQLHMQAKIGWPDGSKILKANGTGTLDEPEALGKRLAEDLLNQGAQEILDACQ